TLEQREEERGDREEPAHAYQSGEPHVRDGRGVGLRGLEERLLQVAEEARVAEAAREGPRGCKPASAASLIARARPSAVEEERADEVVIEEVRRPLRPGVPAAHGLANDAEGPYEDGEASYELEGHGGALQFDLGLLTRDFRANLHVGG